MKGARFLRFLGRCVLKRVAEQAIHSQAGRERSKAPSIKRTFAIELHLVSMDMAHAEEITEKKPRPFHGRGEG
eukprot:1145040-Pelagomonas_calceolata.AAC.4